MRIEASLSSSHLSPWVAGNFIRAMCHIDNERVREWINQNWHIANNEKYRFFKWQKQTDDHRCVLVSKGGSKATAENRQKLLVRWHENLKELIVSCLSLNQCLTPSDALSHPRVRTFRIFWLARRHHQLNELNLLAQSMCPVSLNNESSIEQKMWKIENLRKKWTKNRTK